MDKETKQENTGELLEQFEYPTWLDAVGKNVTLFHDDGEKVRRKDGKLLKVSKHSVKFRVNSGSNKIMHIKNNDIRRVEEETT